MKPPKSQIQKAKSTEDGIKGEKNTKLVVRVFPERQVKILQRLCRGSCSQADLSKEFNIGENTVSEIIRILVDKGLVNRDDTEKTTGGKRRSYDLKITNHGFEEMSSVLDVNDFSKLVFDLQNNDNLIKRLKIDLNMLISNFERNNLGVDLKYSSLYFTRLLNELKKFMRENNDHDVTYSILDILSKEGFLDKDELISKLSKNKSMKKYDEMWIISGMVKGGLIQIRYKQLGEWYFEPEYGLTQFGVLFLINLLINKNTSHADDFSYTGNRWFSERFVEKQVSCKIKDIFSLNAELFPHIRQLVSKLDKDVLLNVVDKITLWYFEDIKLIDIINDKMVWGILESSISISHYDRLKLWSFRKALREALQDWLKSNNYNPKLPASIYNQIKKMNDNTGITFDESDWNNKTEKFNLTGFIMFMEKVIKIKRIDTPKDECELIREEIKDDPRLNMVEKILPMMNEIIKLESITNDYLLSNKLGISGWNYETKNTSALELVENTLSFHFISIMKSIQPYEFNQSMSNHILKDWYNDFHSVCKKKVIEFGEDNLKILKLGVPPKEKV